MKGTVVLNKVMDLSGFEYLWKHFKSFKNTVQRDVFKHSNEQMLHITCLKTLKEEL